MAGSLHRNRANNVTSRHLLGSQAVHCPVSRQGTGYQEHLLLICPYNEDFSGKMDTIILHLVKDTDRLIPLILNIHLLYYPCI